MTGGAPPDGTAFAACAKCPTGEACAAAAFCVLESRFGRADQTIAELTCSRCGRGSESAWGCLETGDGCAAQSPLWGTWFLVRLYANDARAAAAVDQAAAELAAEDDWEPCYHDCDDDCYDEWDQHACRHQHCFNCGGCGCPGYCDDHQTYNFRPDETGG